MHNYNTPPPRKLLYNSVFRNIFTLFIVVSLLFSCDPDDDKKEPSKLATPQALNLSRPDSVVEGQTKITIYWAPVSEATAYQIQQRQGNGEWTDASATISTTRASISGLTVATAYSFRIRALKSKRNSDYSPVISLATLSASATKLATAPSGLKARPPKDIAKQSTGVDLSWAALSGDVTGYEVQYYTTNNEWAKAAINSVAGQASLNINDLSPETKYYFRIRAVAAYTDSEKAPSAWSSGIAEMIYPVNKAELSVLINARITSSNPSPDLTDIYTGKITDMSSLFGGKTTFNGDISSWNTAKVTTMEGLFYNANSFDGDISGWNTAKVTTMKEMFSGATVFNGNISGWNTAKVTIMEELFFNANSFDGDVSGWNTANVITMRNMFTATAFNGNISSWNTAKVTHMGSMFKNTNAFNRDISGWNTANVINMASMFNKATAFDQNISGWNTARVVTMENMFNGATTFNQSISSWNTTNVTTMAWMFNGATAFDQNLSRWNVGKIKYHIDVFKDSGMATECAKWPSFPTGSNGPTCS